MPADVVVAKIVIPREAVLPLALALGALLILIFAGSALAAWRARNPGQARVVGMVLAVAFTGYAVYAAATILPAKYIDHGAPGAKTLGFLDGPIAGFCAVMGALLWRFAGQRWIGLAVGVGLGLALFIKPFVAPLHGWYDGHEHPWHFMDPEHLSFHGPGVAAMIAGLIAGLKQPSPGP
jgi:hypothetical protein